MRACSRTHGSTQTSHVELQHSLHEVSHLLLKSDLPVVLPPDLLQDGQRELSVMLHQLVHADLSKEILPHGAVFAIVNAHQLHQLFALLQV